MEQLEQILSTVHTLLKADGAVHAASIVRTLPAKAVMTGYDNWDGGITFYEVRFSVPASDFARLGTSKKHLEEQITASLQVATEHDKHSAFDALLIPAAASGRDWRLDGQALPRHVRMNIIDGLRLGNVAWAGKLEEPDFLGRLYPLEKLPSNDARYSNAARDIWQHRVNNDDWEPDWVFADSRFDLMDGPPTVFLRFLCEIVHPVVRPDKDDALKIVSHLNEQLHLAGWEIFEETLLAGHPCYGFRELVRQGAQVVGRAKSIADVLDAGWMAQEILRLESSIEKDPALAIGTAKELIETCCKTILARQGVEVSRKDDIGDLTKKLAKELKLVPDGISETTRGADNIRQVLRNLTQIAHNLAELRGLYGTGHGRDGQYRGLQPRHARLAVASAVAFVEFVTETHLQRHTSGKTAGANT